MSTFVRLVFLSLLVVSLGFGATLEYDIVSDIDTGSPVDAPAVSKTVFDLSTPDIWVYVKVSDAKIGDVLQIQWIGPSGIVEDYSTFDPLDEDGDWYFRTTLFYMGVGNWQVLGLWQNAATQNVTQLFSRSFTINDSNLCGSIDPNSNLARNCSAEMGDASSTCASLDSIPAWNAFDGPSVCAYGTTGGYPDQNTPGSPNRGANFFSGGTSDDTRLAQYIDINFWANQIDAGTMPYTLAGYLGGLGAQDDYVDLGVLFLDSDLDTISSDYTNGVDAAERGNTTSFLFQKTSGVIPVGARYAYVRVHTVRDGTVAVAAQNHGYADDLYFGLVEDVTAGQQCSYTLVPTSASLTAAGGDRSVNVVATPTSCAWTATSNAAWITITSGASGAGNGSVNYTVAANTSTNGRTGTMTIAGKTFTVTQSGAAGTSDGPVINAVLNAGSYAPADLPSGALAQGSFVSIFGTGLGPANWVQPTSFPLPTEDGLDGTVVQVRQGGTVVYAVVMFVWETQINAILPSNAPLGNAELIVTRGGRQATFPIEIVKHNFGALGLLGGRGQGVIQNIDPVTGAPTLNSKDNSAALGQTVILWGTGLGAISAPDNMAPPAGDLPYDIRVYVGDKLADKKYYGRAPCCAGVDELVFATTPGTPLGCNVPVRVEIQNSTTSVSNTVTMALSQNGQACTDLLDPITELIDTGGRIGVALLLRGQASIPLAEGAPPTDLSIDVGLAAFANAGAGTDLSSILPFLNLPPTGSCQVLSGALDLEDLLGGININDPTGSLPGETPEVDVTLLDAGNVSLQGPMGTMPFMLIDEEQPGLYVGLLGGSIPMEGITLPPPFLEAGNYTLTATGGSGVPAFNLALPQRNPFNWTNRANLDAINRGQSFTVNWTGGNPNDGVVIVGAAADQTKDVAAAFYCFAPASAGSFTVPGTATSGLPTVGSATSLEDSGAILLVGSTPQISDSVVTVPGANFDRFFAAHSTVDVRLIEVR